MATAVALPPGLRNRIAAVAHRVRRLRFLRGLSLLTLILTLGFGAALLADFFLDLSSPVRIGVFGAWAGVGLIVFSSDCCCRSAAGSTTTPSPPSSRKNIPTLANASRPPSNWPAPATSFTARRN